MAALQAALRGAVKKARWSRAAARVSSRTASVTTPDKLRKPSLSCARALTWMIVSSDSQNVARFFMLRSYSMSPYVVKGT